MSIGLLFWVIYVVCILLGFGTADRARPYWFGYPLVIAVLFFLLGWHSFGFVVHG